MFQALEFSYIWVIQSREERGGYCLWRGLTKPVCAHKYIHVHTHRFRKASSYVKKIMENFSQERLQLCISTKLTPCFLYYFKSKCLAQRLGCTGHTFSKWPCVIFGVQAEFTNHPLQYCPWSPSLDNFSLLANSEHALQALLDAIPSPLKSIVILTLSSIDL